MKKTIGEVIAFYRKQKKLSQIDLTTRLEQYGICVKNAAVSSWEKNNNTPTAKQLLAICEILEITDIYGEFIGSVPDNAFSSLNALGKERAMEYIRLLSLESRFTSEDQELFYTVTDNSMEPRFSIGQQIKITPKNSISSGEIGVFCLNGKRVLRQYYSNDRGTYLLALNSMYPPIPVTSSDQIAVEVVC